MFRENCFTQQVVLKWLVNSRGFVFAENYPALFYREISFQAI